MTQHRRDHDLVNSFVHFFGCGKINQDSRGQAVYYVVQRLSDLTEKIIPFFDKHPLLGIKVKDFDDFKCARIVSAASKINGIKGSFN